MVDKQKMWDQKGRVHMVKRKNFGDARKHGWVPAPHDAEVSAAIAAVKQGIIPKKAEKVKLKVSPVASEPKTAPVEKKPAVVEKLVDAPAENPDKE